MRMRGESDFHIEIFTNIRRGQKGELGTRCPELALLTAPNIREYLYTKIRFSDHHSKINNHQHGCIIVKSKI